MAAEVNQHIEAQDKERDWDFENNTGKLNSLSFKVQKICDIQNLFLSYIVDWQLTNDEENPTQLKLFFPEYGFLK